MKTATLIAILLATLGLAGCDSLATQFGYVSTEEAKSIFANDSYRTVLQPNTPASIDMTTPDEPNVLYVNVSVCKPIGTVGDVARFECPKPPLPPKVEPETHAEHEAESGAAETAKP